MNVTRESCGEVTVIRPESGHLDASTSKEFRRDVVEGLREGMRVVIDLGNVLFVDSSGCGAILACSRRVDPDGTGVGEVRLCSVTKAVRSVFQMVRLHRVLAIHNDREEALRAFEHATAGASAEG